MPKHEPCTPKAIANRLKAKGLQKLRWYCQMCEKQCRDQNGFKCHLTSESHQRQLLLFSENSGRFMNEFSTEFQKGFLDILRRQFGTKRVKANMVYQEYIKDRHHVHMNSTSWYTLTGFVNFLGRTGICKVDKTEKGWFIQYIDREADERREKLAKKAKMDKDDDELMQELAMKQAEVAKQKLGTEKLKQQVNAFTELHKAEDQKVEFKLPKFADVKPKVSLLLSGLPDKGLKDDEVEIVSKNSTTDLSSVETKTKTRPKSAGKVYSSALEEIIEMEERRKDRLNRKDYWLHTGIVVKVIDGDLNFRGRKGVVDSLDDEYTAKVKLLDDTGDIITVHQSHLETVIPALGKTILVVNGAYRGLKATLLALDEDNFCVSVQIAEGPTKDRVVKGVQYEDICKLYQSCI
ncbi:unnamed protein product [Soboliphyme baturini]|uniref:Kin17_mid domain-containing protein n=1 Tax=Soboliphyme baturini TaxID=241478 RepID=A0A183IJD1_9BILA|nr:unnamed protein product [Soboliphyme baturini]